MITASLICDTLRAHTFVYRNEKQLQEGIALAFTAAGITAEPEVELSPTNIIDFMSHG